ncbi:uncharacterized protein C8Q71DRAFT_861870 [Rhodofomes roseus]|uniref:Uncharacterized protein n=1 Tax=Rhodofomes roseus TaxID=34475 RepID=A0ABQ8K2R3_9APHY|nr:uncharacterized protein C8Q71DRAFT_861870 [Rhodofomes roseus]KAH9831136.1 hypothetical protein C8Q71DRAFT_861870 [Rhodofomes roseus]
MATTKGYGTTTAAPAAPRRRSSPTHDVCLYFLALILPPLAVFFKRGLLADFWINVCLSILGWIPGVLHAWYIISRSEGAM